MSCFRLSGPELLLKKYENQLCSTEDNYTNVACPQACQLLNAGFSLNVAN